MPKNEIKLNDWEYLDISKTKIPSNVRNSSDPKVISDYINSAPADISAHDLNYLKHRLASTEKINGKIDSIHSSLNAGTYVPNYSSVVVDEDNKYYAINGLNQKSFQTGKNGCWSCSLNLLLQSRGVNDLTQEDIRAFRPGKSDDEPYGFDADIEMNGDERANIIDMADLVTGLVPDTMVRSTEIWSYRKYKNGAEKDEMEQLTYNGSAIEAIKQQIITAIKVHHSPVSIMKDGHYTTIIAIEGNKVCYLDSMPGANNSNPESDPNHVYESDIYTLLDPAFNGEFADSITITWLEDIKLSKKDNIILNASAPDVYADDNGNTLATTKESQIFFVDERHQDGVIIGTTGGIDISDEDSDFRMNTDSGFFKIEKTYMPKVLNMKSLKEKAAYRSDEEEINLINARNEKLKARKDKEDSIALAKKNDLQKQQVNAKVDIPRFVIPVIFKGKPQFGGGTSLVDYKIFMNGLGWDKARFDSLLCAFSNLYDAVPFDNANINQQTAMNLAFTNILDNAGKNNPGTVLKLKNTLSKFLNVVKNGGTYYDDKSKEVKVIGINGRNDTADRVKKSVKYIECYIDTLTAIADINPNIQSDSLDIDSFIDPDGNIRMDKLQNDPVINPMPEEQNNINFLWEEPNDQLIETQIQYEEDGVSISPKCKYKFYNTGETFDSAYKKLLEMDKTPKDQIDPNLKFTLILIAGYWKPHQTSDAIYLTEDDFIYLGERYEKDPNFAKAIEDMVENGYGKSLWGDKDLLTGYIYHSKSYDPVAINSLEDSLKDTAFELQRPAAYSEDAIGEFPPEKQKIFENKMLKLISQCKYQKNIMLEEEQKKLARDTDMILRDFAQLKKDLTGGNERHDSVPYDQNPFTDYYRAARIITHTEAKPFIAYDSDHIDWQIQEWDKEIFDKTKELSQSLNFHMYLQENKNVIGAMSEKEFAVYYREFEQAALEGDKLVDDYNNLFGKDFENSYSRDNVKESCRNFYHKAADRRLPYFRNEIVKAADLIIAHTLTSKASQAAVFDKLKTNDNGTLDTDKFHKTIGSMRQELISSTEFLNAFAKSLSPSEFYKEYQRAINRTVNKKIEDEYSRIKAIDKSSPEERNRINNFLTNPENIQTITKKQALEIRTAYENLTEYNKGKSPSTRMKKLMDSLEAVVNELNENEGKNRDIHLDKLVKLNKYTMKYYNHRQGVFHNPYTDDGKSRLAAVERLSRTTDQISKQMLKENPEIMPGYTAPESDYDKEQEQKAKTQAREAVAERDSLSGRNSVASVYANEKDINKQPMRPSRH